MNATDLWPRYCAWFRHYPAVGISLDVSQIRFTPEFLKEMGPRIEAAFREMRELEAGAIANPDENRMVGHYWLRLPTLAPTAELTRDIESTLVEIKRFAQDVRNGRIVSVTGKPFSQLLLIGIGGSALGPQLVVDALGGANDPMRVFFCDNTDPDGILRLRDMLDPKLGETLVLVISKSGSTPETRNGAIEIAHAFRQSGLHFPKNAVAVTSPGSKLDAQAAQENWLARFPMWDWVGGRTSLFSAVGLLPAALHGVDVDALLRGAATMDEITRQPDRENNPALLLALMWFFEGDGKGKKDMVVLPYRDRLMLMSKYLQQLVMESLGKEKDRSGRVVHQGIAVYGNKGSTDQHAYVQQLREGVNNFFVTFIEVLRDAIEPAALTKLAEVEPGITSGDYLLGFLLGTRSALYENGRDSLMITLDEISPRTLGALIALYERAVGFYASFTNINAYHQPGVEAGKKAAARVLELQKKVIAELKQGGAKRGAVSAMELATALGAPGEVETVYKILEHLASNPERGLVREQDGPPEVRRYRLREHTCPT